MSPVRYELGSYIHKDGILHSHRRATHQVLHIYDGEVTCEEISNVTYRYLDIAIGLQTELSHISSANWSIPHCV
jgi:hypothetical protein